MSINGTKTDIKSELEIESGSLRQDNEVFVDPPLALKGRAKFTPNHPRSALCQRRITPCRPEGRMDSLGSNKLCHDRLYSLPEHMEGSIPLSLTICTSSAAVEDLSGLKHLTG